MNPQFEHDSLALLHGMGARYQRSGQPQRALVMWLLAAHMAPHDAAVLRSLARAFTDNGEPARALNALERLQALGAPRPLDTLLRARALWHTGEHAAARGCFAAYLQQREAQP